MRVERQDLSNQQNTAKPLRPDRYYRADSEFSSSIKLVAIDIDDTLLNPQKRITPRVLEAIQAAQAAGIIITLATARRYENSADIANELGIEIPLIICDGALVMHYPQQKVVHTNLLNAEIAQQAIEIMVRHHVQPIVEHINRNQEETWTGHVEFDNSELKTYLTLFPDIYRATYETLCIEQPNPVRVVAFASEEAITSLVPAISMLDCKWYTVKRGNYGCAQLVLMNKFCSKAYALATLAQHLCVPLGQVMAIGDNTNDIEMLQIAGWGVAMGQAPDEVKAIAHAVTASNTEDGVALAIEQYALPYALSCDQVIVTDLNIVTEGL